jgi:hypothetical protein
VDTNSTAYAIGYIIGALFRLLVVGVICGLIPLAIARK